MKSFKNKVAVVTGGAAGIGQALVVELARRGADVATCDVADLGETEERVREQGVRYYGQRTDIGKKGERRAFVDAVLKTYGHLDLLINNAGIALGDRTFAEVTDADFEKITDVNYWGVVHTTKLFYETLLSRTEAAIVNISSSQGILGAPFLVPYCTTKFAVRGFSDALRTEHYVRGIKNVTVHAVHPGAVATNITLNADYHGANTDRFHRQLQKGTSPDRAARVILDGVRKRRPRIMVSDGPLQDAVARLVPSHSHLVVDAFARLVGASVR